MNRASCSRIVSWRLPIKTHWSYHPFWVNFNFKLKLITCQVDRRNRWIPRGRPFDAKCWFDRNPSAMSKKFSMKTLKWEVALHTTNIESLTYRFRLMTHQWWASNTWNKKLQDAQNESNNFIKCKHFRWIILSRCDRPPIWSFEKSKKFKTFLNVVICSSLSRPV